MDWESKKQKETSYSCSVADKDKARIDLLHACLLVHANRPYGHEFSSSGRKAYPKVRSEHTDAGCWV